jgi:flagellar biosynthetic protein FliR
MLPVVARVAGIFVFAPVLGGSAVPLRLRYFLSVVIALVVIQNLGWPAAPAGAADLAAAVAQQLLVGLTIGYAARLVFVGVELAAAHAAQQMGLALGELFNPSGTEGGGAVQRLFWILAAVIFLAIGGHRVILGGLLETFRAVPPSAVLPAQAVLETAAGLLRASFELGLKIASPILVAMLLASVALGMLQKSMPQCNLLSVGLPARVLVGLVLLAASIAVMVPLLGTVLGALSNELSALWRAAG